MLPCKRPCAPLSQVPRDVACPAGAVAEVEEGAAGAEGTVVRLPPAVPAGVKGGVESSVWATTSSDPAP